MLLYLAKCLFQHKGVNAFRSMPLEALPIQQEVVRLQVLCKPISNLFNLTCLQLDLFASFNLLIISIEADLRAPIGTAASQGPGRDVDSMLLNVSDLTHAV